MFSALQEKILDQAKKAGPKSLGQSVAARSLNEGAFKMKSPRYRGDSLLGQNIVM